MSFRHNPVIDLTSVSTETVQLKQFNFNTRRFGLSKQGQEVMTNESFTLTNSNVKAVLNDVTIF